MTDHSRDGGAAADEHAARFLAIINDIIHEYIEGEHERLLDIEACALRNNWSDEQRRAVRRKAETTVAQVAAQLPGVQSSAWSVRRLERWLASRNLSTPRWLIGTRRVELAKRLMTVQRMEIDDAAYFVNREREALDALFKSREGMTAAQWLGLRRRNDKRG